MYRQGYRYRKAGIGLLDLTHSDRQQADLFAQADPRSKTLMDVMDRANARFGRGALGLASSAWRPGKGGLERPVWGMNQVALSGRYTTRWDELPTAL
jgi:DNA polymerase V